MLPMWVLVHTAASVATPQKCKNKPLKGRVKNKGKGIDLLRLDGCTAT
jgi:hypothetical protein